MRCAAYCRVSTHEADQLNSLQNQIQHYSELFQKEGYEPARAGVYYKKDGTYQEIDSGIYADEGITGTKLKNRKAFHQLMRAAEDREFDIVFCKNVQRYARNVKDGSESLKRLKQLGIKVIFEDGGLDSWKHEMIINMFLSVAQEESQIKSNSIKFGIRRAQQKGKWTSNCPYGYNRVEGFLQINESEAEIIRKIYDFYVNKNWGQSKIARYLNEINIRTKKDEGRWYQQHIKGILTNPLYIGIQATHKSENMDTNVTLIDPVPEDEWIVKEKSELMIVDKDTFEKAQKISQKRSKDFTNGYRHSDVNLFSTICRCSNCGATMRRKRKRTKVKQKMVYLDSYEYVCSTNDLLGPKHCQYRNAVDEETLLEFVKNEIDLYQNCGGKGFLEVRLDMYLASYLDLNTDKQLQEIDQQLNELKKLQDNRIRLNTMDKDIVSDQELMECSKEYRKQVNELQSKRIKAVNLDKEVEEVKRQYDELIGYIDSIDCNKLDNTALKKLFARIEVKTDTYAPEREAEVPFNWVNEKKCECKYLASYFNFIDKDEGQIIGDYLKVSHWTKP